jgi:hypothetical protein
MLALNAEYDVLLVSRTRCRRLWRYLGAAVLINCYNWLPTVNGFIIISLLSFQKVQLPSNL